MKKNILFTFSFISLISFNLIGQNLGRMFKPSEVLITEQGITMYDKFTLLFGDSIRRDEVENPVEGKMEDLYENGQALHNGYYAAGHLNSFTNFYEDGTAEREYTKSNDVKSKLKTFYKNGKLKSEIEYQNKLQAKRKDMFDNGVMKYTHAYDKGMEYFLFKKSFFENKKPQLKFELTDPNEITYANLEFYESGTLKEEGEKKYNPQTKDYDKIGNWKYFDESGAPVSESKAIAKKAPATTDQTSAAVATSILAPAGSLPTDLKLADKNNDNAITPDEITASIDAFFDGDVNYTPAKITNLIDYFFQQ